MTFRYFTGRPSLVAGVYFHRCAALSRSRSYDGKAGSDMVRDSTSPCSSTITSMVPRKIRYAKTGLRRNPCRHPLIDDHWWDHVKVSCFIHRAEPRVTLEPGGVTFELFGAKGQGLQSAYSQVKAGALVG